MEKCQKQPRSSGARWCGAAAAAVLLMACGGGGSGSAPAAYTVAYNGNGATGGSAPVDSGSYKQGATVTVLGNTGSLVKTGSSFTSWNTLADGTGTSYTAGQTCTMGSANLTFYAKWTANATAGNVLYDGNGATSGSVPVDGTVYGTGQNVTVLGNPGNLAYPGYTFIGWQTTADGSGQAYKQNQTFPKPSANVTLYALWAGGFAYSANNQGGSGGSISQYTIGPNGALTPMTTPSVATGGNDPRDITADPSGKYIYATNITSETVSQFTVGADGALTAMATPTLLVGDTSGGKLYYPMGITVHPTGKYAYLVNNQMGTINLYAVGADGSLTAMASPTVRAGGYPVAIAVDPSGKWAYVPTGDGNNVAQFTIDGTTGALTPMAAATVATGSNAYDIKLTPNGKYAYVANYFSAFISQYDVDAGTGALTPMTVPTAAIPSSGTGAASIVVDPSGRFAYAVVFISQVTPAAIVAQYTIDPTTGALTAMATPTVAAGGAGGAVITVESSGKYAYVTSGDTGWGSTSIAQYSIDPTTGALTLLTHPTVQAGYSPTGIVTIGK